jgi:putative membrane protein
VRINMYDMMGGSGLGYGYMGLGLIFWILIIVGVVLLIKWFVDQGKTTGGEQQMSAMELLKTRYARGEITAEEFEEMKKRLI